MPAPTTLAANEASPKSDEPKSYSSFDFARTRIKAVIDDWSSVTDETERYRLLRYMKMEKTTLESLGLFKEDEIYTAVRLIDQNIRAEQPQYISYISQSRRSSIFKQKAPYKNRRATADGIQRVEENFTDATRYQHWMKPFIRVADGTLTHGWDFVEVLLDTSKPGHFSIEHVGHDQLLFDRETENIQNQELVIRVIKYTAIQLRANAKKFGFEGGQVEKIIGNTPNNEQKTKDIQYKVYKCFYKENDTVMVAWYGGADSTTWLKKPEKLFLGRRDVNGGMTVDTGAKDPVTQKPVMDYAELPETEYPFYILSYIESENPKIADLKGRAFLDEPVQEAASGILSGVVNMQMRANNVYASPNPVGVQPTDTAAPKQLDCKLRHGGIYDKPLNFWSAPAPDPSALNMLQTITQINKAETAKVDFAVANRKDSRKTAKEVEASMQEASQLGSVQVILLSSFMVNVYTRCWEIYSNRVLQKKIEVEPELLPLFALEYTLKSAGDTDVVERQEKFGKLQASWPVISKTAIANEFLKVYLRVAFPEDAEHLVQFFDQSNQGKQLVTGMLAMIKELAVDPATGQPRPEVAAHMQELQQLEANAQQYIQSGQEGAAEKSQLFEDLIPEDGAGAIGPQKLQSMLSMR